MEITLQYPDRIARFLPARSDFSREMLEAYAADAYRNERISLHQVCVMLDLDRWKAEEFLARRHALRPFTQADLDLEREPRGGR
ncbi:MAG: UPF0175 family protein [Limisphaerales bacterium]